ncbi:hypothetical protein ES319_A10G266100v1 [Gossypium barbadense]|uniref:NB-ARC domain-containing protein n=2 Tax=Gossypium TaxID=3633 RepID=A0A5J5UBU9_GOSBA|nr:hypothetical protein ES319_A10G266100v1 [Gossypium barbadense]TYH00677.1 hypothetical protein ES288_A10G298100v1 [Gossypium darwinii]
MTKIVGNDGGYQKKIVVSKLKCLQLSKLHSLTSFCPGNYTFNFPSLEELVMEGCPRLKIFFREFQVIRSKRMQFNGTSD